MNDTWLLPVLVAGGVLTPDQLAELGEIATTLWAAVVGAGLATDALVTDAVARRFRVPLANPRRCGPHHCRSSSSPHSTAGARKKPWISARRTT